MNWTQGYTPADTDLYNRAEPTRVSHVLQPYGTVLLSLPVVRIGRIAPYLRVRAFQAGLVLGDARLQNSKAQRNQSEAKCPWLNIRLHNNTSHCFLLEWIFISSSEVRNRTQRDLWEHTCWWPALHRWCPSPWRPCSTPPNWGRWHAEGHLYRLRWDRLHLKWLGTLLALNR